MSNKINKLLKLYCREFQRFDCLWLIKKTDENLLIL